MAGFLTMPISSEREGMPPELDDPDRLPLLTSSSPGAASMRCSWDRLLPPSLNSEVLPSPLSTRSLNTLRLSVRSLSSSLSFSPPPPPMNGTEASNRLPGSGIAETAARHASSLLRSASAIAPLAAFSAALVAAPAAPKTPEAAFSALVRTQPTGPAAAPWTASAASWNSLNGPVCSFLGCLPPPLLSSPCCWFLWTGLVTPFTCARGASRNGNPSTKLSLASQLMGSSPRKYS
mmetsp:Transcript_19015/g.38543  ORF Transcript_19015/g.38543 Transcript_19015/m.38543 type:complete len:234 (-) Transcript_19015:740-1441(-)